MDSQLGNPGTNRLNDEKKLQEWPKNKNGNWGSDIRSKGPDIKG